MKKIRRHRPYHYAHHAFTPTLIIVMIAFSVLGYFIIRTSWAEVIPTSPMGVAGSWKLAFNDEFEGTSLDLTKWIMCKPNYAAGCQSPNNQQEQYRYKPNNPNVTVSGGLLHLRATKENGKIYSGIIASGPARHDYANPGFQSHSFTYGFYEGRIKIPRGDGFWPSMFMTADPDTHGGWPNSGEYDIVEIAGNDPTTAYMTVHWAENGAHRQSGQTFKVTDLSTDFHVFGLDWQPSSLAWYMDGKLMRTYTGNGVKNWPFYIVANFAVGGNWGPLQGAPNSSTPFPADFQIDWLRFWQRSTGAPTPPAPTPPPPTPTPTPTPIPAPGSKPGDINRDGKVNLVDLSMLMSKWKTNDPAADLNKSGWVDLVDLSILMSNWNR